MRAWAAAAGGLIAALVLAFSAPRAAPAGNLRHGFEAAAALDAELRSTEVQCARVVLARALEQAPGKRAGIPLGARAASRRPGPC